MVTTTLHMDQYDHERLSYLWSVGYDREMVQETEEWEETVESSIERGDGPYDARLKISDKENEDSWITSNKVYDLMRVR